MINYLKKKKKFLNICVLKTTFCNKIHKQTKHSNSSPFTVITELLNQE